MDRRKLKILLQEYIELQEREGISQSEAIRLLARKNYYSVSAMYKYIREAKNLRAEGVI